MQGQRVGRALLLAFTSTRCAHSMASVPGVVVPGLLHCCKCPQHGYRDCNATGSEAARQLLPSLHPLST